MAINTDGNPITIKSQVIATDTEITSRYVYVQKIIWLGVTTASHKANFISANGADLFHFDADAPGASGLMMYTIDFFIHPHPCPGIHCDDLDSGDVYIYLVNM